VKLDGVNVKVTVSGSPQVMDKFQDKEMKLHEEFIGLHKEITHVQNRVRNIYKLMDIHCPFLEKVYDKWVKCNAKAIQRHQKKLAECKKFWEEQKTREGQKINADLEKALERVVLAPEKLVVAVPEKPVVVTEAVKPVPAPEPPVTVAEPVKEDPVQKAKDKLETEISVDFAEAPLSDVLDFVRTKTGLNIVLMCPESGKEKIDVVVKDLKYSSLLKIILEMKGLDYTIDGNGVVVIAKKAAPESPKVEQPATAPAPAAPAPEPKPAESKPEAENPAPKTETAPAPSETTTPK
jgi:hypothetical protein